MTKIHTQSEPQASSPSPPYLDPAQCPHEHTSFTGGYHFVGGDVWDDITEVCDDCGAILSYQPMNEDFDDIP